MAFEMMHTDDRLAERETKRVGNSGADQQRSREPGSLRVGNPIEVG